MPDTPTYRLGVCRGLPAMFDMDANARIPAQECVTEIEQERDAVLEQTLGGEQWRPTLCASCDAMLEEFNKAKSQHFIRAGQDHLRRNHLAEANLNDEAATGRRTLDTLPDLYAETRIHGGVHPDRYREIAQIVKDHVSVPPLLRTSGIASILYLHGEKGTGKTWLLEAAVAYAIRELGRGAVFTSPIKVWADIKAGFGGEGKDAEARSEARVISDLSGCALLAIDDIARKTTPTEWEISILLQVVDERYRTNRATLVSSNYSVADLFALWSDANDPRKTKNVELLCDRLSDKRAAISVLMSGKSLRRESK
jgi:DNA replication protein DnaC